MNDAIAPERLHEHVVRLTAHGPRHRDNPPAVTAALEYIEQCLGSYGYGLEWERWGDAAHEVNLIAGGRSGDRPIIELGAHWDTVAGTPGADDNASGVAALLEIARAVAGSPPGSRALRFCVFGGEEDGLLGSYAHVARVDHRVEGAIVLEMIGFRDRRPGSQRIPEGILPLTPEETAAAGLDVGTFVAAVGNTEAGDYLAALGTDERLVVLPVALPADHDSHGGRSDHRPYWLSGRKGVMITDTAEFRNPNYHAPGDTIDTLDFEFAAEVARVVARALRTLAA